MAMCLILSMLLTACSSEGIFDWSQTSQEQPADTAGGLIPSQTAKTFAENRILSLAMPSSAGTLDPLANESAEMANLFPLIYEGLFKLDERAQPALWLAESIEQAEGGYRLKLRPNVVFHDGDPLSAAAVADCFERIKSAGEKGPYASILKAVTAISAVGESELMVESERGYAALYALCFPIAHFGGGDFPSGTGPYLVEKYLGGTEMQLARNPAWWRKPPVIERIQAVAFDDTTPERVESGQIDAALVTLMMESSLYAHSDLNMKEYSTGRVELLAPNLGGKLAPIEMRRAIAALIDRGELLNTALKGHGVAVEVPIWPDSWLAERAEGAGYDLLRAKALLSSLGWEDIDGDGLLEESNSEAVQAFLRATPSPSPSPEPTPSPAPSESPAPGSATPSPSPSPTLSQEEMISLLLGREAGAEQAQFENLSLTLLLGSDQENSLMKDLARALQMQLMRGGIVLQIEELPFKDLLAKMKRGEYDLALMGYSLGASGDLSPLLETGGGSNLNGYQNAAVDGYFAQMRSAQSPEEYKLAAQRVSERVAADLPVFTLLMRTKTLVTSGQLQAEGLPREGDAYHGIETWAFTR
jgi:ABC-type transport system substrate-binding protein